MNTDFEKSFADLMVDEGVYSKDPADPGGETVYGISRKFWPRWSGWVTVDRLKSSGGDLNSKIKNSGLMENEVKAFYYQNFWKELRIDAIQYKPLKYFMFNIGVNKGAKVVKFLQEALNLLNREESLFPDLVVDGGFGPKTLEALHIIEGQGQASKHDLFIWFAIVTGNDYVNSITNDERKEEYVRGWGRRLARNAMPDDKLSYI